MQMVSKEVHEQRQKLILGIAEKHTNERGQVKVEDAFTENPGLRLQLAELKLDTPIRLNAYVLHMRRKGILPNKGIKTYAKRTGNYKGGKIGRKKRPLADIALVHHIKRLYKGKHQPWNHAFEDHPEWKERLGDPSDKATMSFIYRALRQKDPGVPFEQNGAVNGASHDPIKTLPEPAWGTSEVVTCRLCGFSAQGPDMWKQMAEHYATNHGRPPKPAPPEPYMPKVCPECGFNLRVFMAAFQVASKHSGKADR